MLAGQRVWQLHAAVAIGHILQVNRLNSPASTQRRVL
jgi:hypothetical protein